MVYEVGKRYIFGKHIVTLKQPELCEARSLQASLAPPIDLLRFYPFSESPALRKTLLNLMQPLPSVSIYIYMLYNPEFHEKESQEFNRLRVSAKYFHDESSNSPPSESPISNLPHLSLYSTATQNYWRWGFALAQPPNVKICVGNTESILKR